MKTDEPARPSTAEDPDDVVLPPWRTLQIYGCVAVAGAGVWFFWPTEARTTSEGAETIPIAVSGTRIELGEFEIDSGNVLVSDPAYAEDSNLGIPLYKAASGTWETWVTHVVDPQWGKRAAELVAVHRGSTTPRWTSTGAVAVDSGQAGIFDSAHVTDHGLVPKQETSALEAGSPWYSRCCAQTLSDDLAGIIPFGVVSSSGLGDGFYPVLTATSEGRVVGIRIVFMARESQ